MSLSRETGNSSREENAPRSTPRQGETWKPAAAVPGPAETDLSPEAPLVESSKHPPINCPPPSTCGPLREIQEDADTWAALGITCSTLPPSSQDPRAASPAMAVPPAATHESESLARLFETALLQEGVIRPLRSPPPAKPQGPPTTQVTAPVIVTDIALPESSPSSASWPGSADPTPESASQKRRCLKEGTWDAIVARARVDRSERKSVPEDDAGPLSSRAGAIPAIEGWKRRDAVREETSAQRAARLFDEGLSLLRGGDDAGAFDAWSEAVRLDEDKRVYRTNLRKLARKLGRDLEE